MKTHVLMGKIEEVDEIYLARRITTNQASEERKVTARYVVLARSPKFHLYEVRRECTQIHLD